MEYILNPKKDFKPWNFFLTIGRKQIPVLVTLMVLFGIADIIGIIQPYLIGKIIDDLTLHTNTNLYFLIVVLMSSFIVAEILFRIGHILEIFSFSRIRESAKKVLFAHTSSLSFGYFADRFAGEISHKISNITDALEDVMVAVVENLVLNISTVIFSFVILSTVHPQVGIFLLIWSLVFGFCLIPLARMTDKKAGTFSENAAKTSGTMVDIFSNISAVKVYGKKDDNKRVREAIKAESESYKKLGFVSILTYHFQGISTIIFRVIMLVILVGLYKDNLVTVGDIVFVAAASLSFADVIWYLGRNIESFIKARGEMITNLEDIVVAPSILDGHTIQSEKSNYSIVYKDVSFAYPSGNRNILNGFSLSIEEGEKVGIVGLSGAGKTTVVNLLLRFFDPNKGVITIGSTDIRDFSQEFLRSKISHISQESTLFHSTISENIAYGSETASVDEIINASKLAYADEFVASLPQKYNSLVGDRGVKLSGGQRQRIAIARAILANRPIFVLDEATSALDSESEEKIQEGLKNLMKEKTVIAIAHRLSTLLFMDHIVFIENGEIVENGTHTELLALNGKYASLWKKQAGGFLPDTL